MTTPTVALTPEEGAKHVTIWNRLERRKIAGNAAPLRRNLPKYLVTHPECEEYKGQDKDPNLRPGAIDPVTGERISVQNEHVPIWHRREHRKVTGNAAPLRKNLENYLRKHADCEVYTGQDKMPRWNSTNASAANHTGQSSAPHLHAHPSDGTVAIPAAVNQIHQHTHQPVKRWICAPGGKLPWASVRTGFPPVQPQPQPQPGNGKDVPGNLNFMELSYIDMASSWSNNPEWASHGALQAPLTPNPTNGLSGIMPQALATHGPTSPMETGDSHINGIPIPGGVGRERHDIAMGLSFGVGTPTDFFMGDIARSVDGGDIDPMQFSPSNYLAGSFTGRSPPPLRISSSAFRPSP